MRERSLGHLKLMGMLSAAVFAAACATPAEPVGVHEESLVEMGEFLAWWTIVFEDNRLDSREQRDRRRQLYDAGASDVVLLPQIGVAFARFDRGDRPDAVEGVIGVWAAERSGIYTLAGMPSLADLRSGNVDVEAVQARMARRRPHVGGAAPRGERAPTAADTLFETSWGLHRVRAPEAWSYETGSHETVVAVIDTGVAHNHPDLEHNVVHRACFHFSSMTGGPPCNPYPMFTHGTHVAGIISAQFGGGEAVGVGPNLGIASYNVFEPLLLSADVDGDGDIGELYYPLATDVQILGALMDAVDRDYEVVNMSLGMILPSDDSRTSATVEAWRRAIRFATVRGTTVVVAAGNDGDVVDGAGVVVGDLDSDEYISVPAEIEGAITVGATGFRLDEDGRPFDIVAGYSNYGEVVDLAAPGGDSGSGSLDPATYAITSTEILADSFEESIMAELVDAPYAPNPCFAAQRCQPGYLAFEGTSMASPFVAGAVGLSYASSQMSSIPSWIVDNYLRITAQPGPDGVPVGAGIVDASRLVGRDP